MTKKFTEVVKAWKFLNNHPHFDEPTHGCNDFIDLHHFEYMKVNPKTGEIDDNESKNTATRVWAECFVWYLPDNSDNYETGIDMDLKLSAPTTEELIIKISNKVFELYGEAKREVK